MQSSDLSAAMIAVSRDLFKHRTVEATLDAIVHGARTSVPGFDQVGISTVDRKGNIHTRATTGDLVQQLDDLQYTLGEGPCFETLHDADVVAAPFIRNEQRWPRYVPGALEIGLRAQLAVRLFLDDEGTIGGLNLYSTVREDIDPEAEDLAGLFATQAAIALGHARHWEGLNQAISSRQLIGQAVGLLMERYSINGDRAFQFLARTSSHSNIKLRDVAKQIVDEAEQR